MKTLRLTRILSLILVLAMLIQVMPVQSIANSTGSSAVDVETGRPIATILGEVEDLREEDTKHFRLSDGSYIAVSYGMPVHYEGEDGNWKDIDNSISLNNNANAYELNRTDAEVSFANALSNGTVLTTSVGGKSISMSVLDTSQAVMMIAGEAGEDLMGDETTVKEDVSADVTEETVAEMIAGDIVEETIPGTVPEETEEALETTVDETVAETLTETVTESSTETINSVIPEENEDENASETVSANVVESTENVENTSMETTSVENSTVVDEDPEAVEETQTTATDPEETVEATTAIVGEESCPTEELEETEAVTEPEESVPETTESESASLGEMNDNAEVMPVGSNGIIFDRNATAGDL